MTTRDEAATFAAYINGGGTPAPGQGDRRRMVYLGLLRRDEKVTASQPASMVPGQEGELLANVLAAHPDPYWTSSVRSTREWAYRLRQRGWPVRYARRNGGGYYLAVPVESGWRMER